MPFVSFVTSYASSIPNGYYYTEINSPTGGGSSYTQSNGVSLYDYNGRADFDPVSITDDAAGVTFFASKSWSATDSGLYSETSSDSSGLYIQQGGGTSVLSITNASGDYTYSITSTSSSSESYTQLSGTSTTTITGSGQGGGSTSGSGVSQLDFLYTTDTTTLQYTATLSTATQSTTSYYLTRPSNGSTLTDSTITKLYTRLRTTSSQATYSNIKTTRTYDYYINYMYGLDTSSVFIDFIGTGGAFGGEQEALVLFGTGEGSTIITDYQTVLFNGGTGGDSTYSYVLSPDLIYSGGAGQTTSAGKTYSFTHQIVVETEIDTTFFVTSNFSYNTDWRFFKLSTTSATITRSTTISNFETGDSGNIQTSAGSDSFNAGYTATYLYAYLTTSAYQFFSEDDAGQYSFEYTGTGGSLATFTACTNFNSSGDGFTSSGYPANIKRSLQFFQDYNNFVPTIASESAITGIFVTSPSYTEAFTTWSPSEASEILLKMLPAEHRDLRLYPSYVSLFNGSTTISKDPKTTSLSWVTLVQSVGGSDGTAKTVNQTISWSLTGGGFTTTTRSYDFKLSGAVGTTKVAQRTVDDNLSSAYDFRSPQIKILGNEIFFTNGVYTTNNYSLSWHLINNYASSEPRTDIVTGTYPFPIRTAQYNAAVDGFGPFIGNFDQGPYIIRKVAFNTQRALSAGVSLLNQVAGNSDGIAPL